MLSKALIRSAAGQRRLVTGVRRVATKRSTTPRRFCTAKNEKPVAEAAEAANPIPPPPPGNDGGGGSGMYVIGLAALAGGGYYFKDEISAQLGLDSSKPAETDMKEVKEELKILEEKLEKAKPVAAKTEAPAPVMVRSMKSYCKDLKMISIGS